MAIGLDYTWRILGERFPPTINTRLPVTDLQPFETPDAYGIEPNRVGKLASGGCPVGTSAVAKTYTISGNVFSWYLNRLWRISSTQLIYGSPDYISSYYPQGLGHLDFTEDTNAILKILPLRNSMIVFKATGAYLIPNATDPNADFVHSNLIQEAHIAVADRALAINNLVYFSNADGLFSISDQGEIIEITIPTRGSGLFENKALTADYENKYLIGDDDQYCLDLNANNKIFDYRTEGFLYTTPSLRMRGRGDQGNPFTVSRVAFEIEHLAADTDGRIVFATQFDSRGWNDSQTLDVLYERGSTEREHIVLDVQENARAFRMRITTLTGLAIRRIYVNSADFTQNSFDE